MRKQFTLVLAMMLVLVLTINADIWTVNNNTGSPGQFTDLQAAIDNASPGDTLLISGSNDSYGSVTVYKKLTLIGTGWAPQTELAIVSSVQTILFDTIANPVSNPSGSKIIGLEITGAISSYVSSIDSILLLRNKILKINLGENNSNWILKQNWIRRELNIYYNSNVIIMNNIFSAFAYDNIIQSNEPSVLIYNNLFFKGPNIVSHANFSNNIFLNSCPENNIEYCSFYNNITFASVACNDLPYGNNTGSGNINNTDPEFISGSSNPPYYDPEGDYRLSTTSPGKNAGTDGTDIGIYGGSEPFVDGGIPSIPQILLMHVLNPVVPKNTDVNIHVKARTQD